MQTKNSLFIWLSILASIGAKACAEDVADPKEETRDTGNPTSTEGDTDTRSITNGDGGPTETSSDTALDTTLDAGPDDADSTSAPVESISDNSELLDPWYAEATISKRNLLPLPRVFDVLKAEGIVEQLGVYDPGSFIRCAVQNDPTYREAVNTIGGVPWEYSVDILEDESKPVFRAGFPDNSLYDAGAGASSDGASVDIEKADIVGLSATTAFFHSQEHGLLIVDLSGPEPQFNCAAKLPGRINEFYFYEGHLVAMTEQVSGDPSHSYLLHFDMTQGDLKFVEAIDLGPVHILDSRRFNNRLVVYTDLTVEEPPPFDTVIPIYYQSNGTQHRTLRVFSFGDTLTEEMADTLLDTTPNTDYLLSSGIPTETAPGTLVNASSGFGDQLWASDRYFVVTEFLNKIYLTGWETRTYSVCTQSHSNEIPYQHCHTIYEERPNPNFAPPDNSGGDRSCEGMTLADCLRAVSRAANPTIQVPVRSECEQRIRNQIICDAHESQSLTSPNLDTEYETRLHIYEYTSQGFVRLDSNVSEIVNEGLEDQSRNAVIPTLTTSTDTYDLAVPGRLQTLYFQNEMLYAVADGVLQVYAMGGSSLVRTSSLNVVDDRLQTALFTTEKLYLSDFGFSGNRDESVLRIIDLSNPAFPRQTSDDRVLPGGHQSIFPANQGVLTVGRVENFEPGIEQVIKLGLFTDPFASEIAYLILGTDLEYTYLGEDEALTFDKNAERLFLPYYGGERDTGRTIYRVGISRLEDTSIISEGAVPIPELPQRVRPRPGVTNEFLSFSNGTIEWLRPSDTEWTATSVLEYFKPIAIYRYTDEDDYVEALQLGQECKLHFSTADNINATRKDSATDPFFCGHAYSPWAFEKNIIFSDSVGVSFTHEGTFSMLSSEEIREISAVRYNRQHCLFSQELLKNADLDYENPPPMDNMVCYSYEEYQSTLSELLAGSY